MFDRIWQCGQCGGVYHSEDEANNCCDGFEEECYQCLDCGMLYNKRPKKCMECSSKIKGEA